MMGVAALAALMPGVVAAQSTAKLVCPDGVDPVGSLGITGIACDRCQFFTNGHVHRAVFWTEPTIRNLDSSNPAAAVLREGDILVAVDGSLITTREGSERFSALPPDQDAHMRVRRDGRLVDLTVPVAAVCPATRPAAAPVVAGRPVPVSPPTPPTPVAGAGSPPSPPEAPTPGRLTPLTPPAALPAIAPLPPAPAAISPRASLGFGFRCSSCGWRTLDDGSPGRWDFSDPPEVVGIATTRAGRRAGDLEIGDRLIELDGLALTSEEGGRRFAAISPGDTLRWTVLRAGRRMTIATTAHDRATVATAASEPANPDPARAPLRFSGAVGNTTVEVRGGRVTVSEDEGGRLVIIRTADAEIRIRAPGGEGR